MADQTDEKRSGAVTYRIAPMEKYDPVPTRAIVSNAFTPEDEYLQYYVGGNRSINAIQPPYDLRTLDRLTQENNTLGPCIEAMVTNIDGTGFFLLKDAPGAEDDDGNHADPQVLELWDFFNEPWPGESFVTQRKLLRRDVKRTGNGYLEVMRNAKDEIVFTRHVDSKMMRIIRLDDAVPQRVTVKRRGQDVSMTVMVRYRRFVQLVNGVQVRYFKEFGCPLDLDKDTGKWAAAGERLGAQKRATEIMHFIDLPDAHTPYGVPSWINQLPSVLGSRKAEEFNMEFFDNGGVPPVLIILQGGVLASESRKALEQRVSGPATKKNRVQVVEMEPSGGSLDSPAAAKVTVERFGAERQQDAMFENYDSRCEVRIRRAFRLPPIFLGDVSEYNFATAFASYTVAEAQVFRPERDAFDEIMTVKLIPALGYKGLKMVSKGLSIEDATIKLQGIELALQTQQIDAKETLDAINETVGTRLRVSETLPVPQTINPTAPQDKAAPGGSKGSDGAKAGIKTNSTGEKQSNSESKKAKPTPVRSPAVRKSEDELSGICSRLLKGIYDKDHEAITSCIEEMRGLDAEDAEDFAALFADISVTTQPVVQ